MVAKRVCRIPLSDLKTIRLTIDGVSSEIPTENGPLIMFLSRQGEIGRPARDSIIALGDAIRTAMKFSDIVAVEFVLPDDTPAPTTHQ